MNENLWNKIMNYTRSKLHYLYDKNSPFAEDPSLKIEFNIPHVGFYIGITSNTGDDIIREGFLHNNLGNIIDSCDVVVQNLFNNLKHKNIDHDKIATSTFHLTIINKIVPLKNPLQWDQKSDGIYGMWGERYKGLYLPYQIQRMNNTQVEIMDRLCAWELGIASNLWRVPECIVFRLQSQSYSK